MRHISRVNIGWERNSMVRIARMEVQVKMCGVEFGWWVSRGGACE